MFSRRKVLFSSLAGLFGGAALRGSSALGASAASQRADRILPRARGEGGRTAVITPNVPSLPWRMDWKLNGAYTLPWAFRVSTAYAVVNGYSITAGWNAPNAVVAPSLGRDLSAGAPATR